MTDHLQVQEKLKTSEQGDVIIVFLLAGLIRSLVSELEFLPPDSDIGPAVVLRQVSHDLHLTSLLPSTEDGSHDWTISVNGDTGAPIIAT